MRGRPSDGEWGDNRFEKRVQEMGNDKNERGKEVKKKVKNVI